MLNERDRSTHSPKLSEVLFPQAEPSFASLATLPSNVEAIEAALLFSAGMIPYVAIVGPSGWGKSHLMRAVAGRLRLDGIANACPMTVNEFLIAPGRQDSAAPLILEDIQEVLSKPRQRLGLRMALERRVKTNRPTIVSFTAPKVSRQIRGFLPSAREWSVATVDEPASSERMLLLNGMAGAEGLTLSSRLVRILAREMHGNGRTYAGALKRLRLTDATWLNPRETLRALGVLDPFFADNSSWDLKLKILRVAESARAQFTRSNPLDLALYTMLHEAGLGEADVARAAGISPADAYSRAAFFQKQFADAAYVHRFAELVIGSLANE